MAIVAKSAKIMERNVDRSLCITFVNVGEKSVSKSYIYRKEVLFVDYNLIRFLTVAGSDIYTHYPNFKM